MQEEKKCKDEKKLLDLWCMFAIVICDFERFALGRHTNDRKAHRVHTWKARPSHYTLASLSFSDRDNKQLMHDQCYKYHRRMFDLVTILMIVICCRYDQHLYRCLMELQHLYPEMIISDIQRLRKTYLSHFYFILTSKTLPNSIALQIRSIHR